MNPNDSLKEDIRAYWSARAETFDLSSGHGIRTKAEKTAWANLLGGLLGPAAGGRVLELASGTGEVTSILLDLGCRVTGIDLAAPMVARARAKLNGRAGWRIHQADAEDTREPNAHYDTVVCRNLVWTLTDPAAALVDWLRVLKPGGRLVVIDGDWVNMPRHGRFRAWLARVIARLPGQTPEPPIDWAANNAIQRQLPFNRGLTVAALAPHLHAAGFGPIHQAALHAVHRVQRRAESPFDRLPQRLRVGMYADFALMTETPSS